MWGMCVGKVYEGVYMWEYVGSVWGGCELFGGGVCEGMCEGVCVHVSCVSGNVEVSVFIVEGTETWEHKYILIFQNCTFL